MSSAVSLAAWEGARCAGCNSPHALVDAFGVCDQCLWLLSKEDIEALRMGGAQFRARLAELVCMRIATSRLGGATSGQFVYTLLSFSPAIVGAEAGMHLAVRSHEYCKPIALSLPSRVTAEAFEIRDIQVGHRSQMLAQAGGFSAEFFSDAYIRQWGRLPLSIDVLAPAVNFSMVVFNKTKQPQTFEAVWTVRKVVE